jgi:hypothetical protein
VILADGATLNVCIAGTLNLSESDLALENIVPMRSVAIDNTGVFDVQDDSSIIDGGDARGLFTNEGLFQKSGGGGTTRVGIPYVTSGLTLRRSGVLRFAGSSTQMTKGTTDVGGGTIAVSGSPFEIEGGELVGGGTLDGSVVNDYGTVAPGGATSYVLTITGDFMQPSHVVLDNQVRVGVGGSAASGYQFGQLAVQRTALLNGEFDIYWATTDGSRPFNFPFITYATESGTFAGIEGDSCLVGVYNPYFFTLDTDPECYAASPGSMGTSNGPTGGGTPVTISGTGFISPLGKKTVSSVTFGGVPALSFTTNSATSLTAVSPPHAVGTATVLINGTGFPGNQFTYTASPVPSVSSISPSFGTAGGGTVATISGSNFNGTTVVSFGGTSAYFEVLSNTTIKVWTPSHSSGTVDITVTTYSGTSSLTAADQFNYLGAPSLSTISLPSGSTGGGNVLTLTGMNFTGATLVYFGTTATSSFTVNSNTQITVTTPPHAAGTWDITVATASGRSPTLVADRYTYLAAPAPAITSLSTTSGSTAGGAVVLITGTNLSEATAVSFGSFAVTRFTVNSDTLITAVAPPQPAGVVDIRVTTYTGNSAPLAADRFTYVAAPQPSVTAVSPGSGSAGGGARVSISGSHFTGATMVCFGTVPSTNFTVYSDSSIVALVPPQAVATVDITVITYSGTSATGAADHFTYNAAPVPAISLVTPATGSAVGGTLVTILGTNFSGATSVSFGSVAASYYRVISDTAIMARAPAGVAGLVDMRVSTYSGTSPIVAADRFTYVAPPVPAVTSLSASSGTSAGGTVVTITGSGFTNATGVFFGSIWANQFTVNSDTLITVLAPPHAAGSWDVTVSTPGGTSALVAADRFTYNAAPAPAITNLSTSTGTTAGGAWVTISGSNLTAVRKEPSPLPSKILTVFEPLIATRSNVPSPSKSPAAMAPGPPGTA